MSASSAEKAAPERLRVGPYVLSPVTGIRQDDLASLFGDAPGVYVCNCQEGAWYERFGMKRSYNYAVEKKHRMFGRLPPGSKWVSPTFDPHADGDTEDFQNGPVLHLGYGRARGRAAQLVQAAKIARWLVEHRDEYAFVYVYNFYGPTYPPALVAKLLGKRVYVDYEDDYTFLRPPAKAMLEKVLRRTPDGVVCINEGMTRYFPDKEVRVFNAFADLSYLEGTTPQLVEGMTFLYTGRLDDLRGIDLVPELVRALRERLGSFRIRITGDGPLRPLVESWDFEEVEYLGFLPEGAFGEEVAAADACLILQKPDHGFSRGSFPSKIDAYAQYRRPIWVLEMP